MGSVYRAYDRELERFVAVKVFAPGAAGDDARRRGEARMLARLSHPHLVSLHDAHLAADGDATPSFLVMELVDGEDLRYRLQRGPLAAEDAAAVATDIASALVVVHGAGMVHRDLKPANILLAESGIPGDRPVVKLADFGIAHLMGSERLTTVGTVIGTAGYLSPEQISGIEPGPSADIYALGLVVLEALTGVREYPGTPIEAVTARAARAPRIPATLPEDWRRLLAAMTDRDPALRPSAVDVAVKSRQLAPQLAGWTPGAVPTEPLARELEPTVLMPVVGGAAVGSAGGAAAGGAAAGVAATGGAAVFTGTEEADAAETASGDPWWRHRRGLATAVLGGGIVALVGLTLALGSVLAPAPAATPPESGTTPRPTPAVIAPAQSIAPVVSPAPSAPAPAPPAPAPPSHSKSAPKGPAGGDHKPGRH